MHFTALLCMLLASYASAIPWTAMSKNSQKAGFRDLQNILRSTEIQRVLAENSNNSLSQNADRNSDTNGCACVKYDCGCCVHMDVKEIHLDTTGCVNITYLPSPEYGISAMLTLGDKTVINETVSARNPPSICVDVPHLKKLASVCLHFYDLTVSKSSFSGCVKLEARLAMMEVANIKLGCFTIPPNGLAQGRQQGSDYLLDYQGRQSNLENILRSPEIQRVLAEKSNTQSADGKSDSNGCSCVKYNCGCCVHMDVKDIHLNTTGCVNITYLPSPEYGISATLTLGDKTIINETVSARNPPPICVGVPYLEKLASVCLHFYDMTVLNSSLSGCVKLEARLEGVSVTEIKIGCFTIPPKGLAQGGQQGSDYLLDFQGRQSNLENLLRSPEIQRVLAEKSDNSLSQSADGKSDTNGCSCVKYDCGCCVHMDVKEIHLNTTGCVNITYLPSPDYGISATLTLGDKTIINETVSARNPPPICVGVPYLEKLASVCLHFYDMTVLNSSLSGCVNITYLPSPDYGISATLTLGDKTIINETVSARNPPPICVGVPYLEKLASVCLHFYDMTVLNSSLSGCVKLEARLAEVTVTEIKIGCFTIPPKGPAQGRQQGSDYLLDFQGRQSSEIYFHDKYSQYKRPEKPVNIYTNRRQQILLRLHRN